MISFQYFSFVRLHHSVLFLKQSELENAARNLRGDQRTQFSYIVSFSGDGSSPRWVPKIFTKIAAIMILFLKRDSFSLCACSLCNSGNTCWQNLLKIQFCFLQYDVRITLAFSILKRTESKIMCFWKLLCIKLTCWTTDVIISIS